jgi:uncharacterized protein YoxC
LGAWDEFVLVLTQVVDLDLEMEKIQPALAHLDNTASQIEKEMDGLEEELPWLYATSRNVFESDNSTSLLLGCLRVLIL